MEDRVLSRPGARALVHAIGYARDGAFFTLAAPDAPVTLDRLRVAIAALSAARRSDAFAAATRVAALPADEQAALEARAARRAAHKRRAPPEPAADNSEGGVCTVRLLVADADGGFSARATRRFRADDTFDGVLAYARGDDALSAWSDAAPLDDDAAADEVLVARDVTCRREPPPILTARADGGRTLMALGFWPSARLELTTAAAVAKAASTAPAHAAPAPADASSRPKPSAMLKLSHDGARFGAAPADGAREHHRVHGARAAALKAAEARRAQEQQDMLLALRMQQDEEDALARRQREVDARA